MSYTAIIVEDEPWSLIDIQKTFPFSSFDFEVISSFQDPISALDMILKLKPDLIVTDINMPNLSGIELMEKVRMNHVDSEIVIISGYNEFAYAQQAIKYGALAYCLKPTNSREVREAMQKVKIQLDKKNEQKHGDPKTESENKSSFDKLVSYIDSHFFEKLVLNDLANLFNFNPNYCCSLFAKYKNTTFSQYVANIKIKNAKLLMDTTDYTLEKIAGAVGFSDYFYFSKVFKKACGISPKEYKTKRRLPQ